MAIELNKKTSFIIGGLILLGGSIIFGLQLWKYSTSPSTLQTELESFGTSGNEIIKDFDRLSEVAVTKTDGGFEVVDDFKSGIDVQFSEQKQEEKSREEMKISFPENFEKPIEIALSGSRMVTITNKNGKGMSAETLVRENQQGEDFTHNDLLPEETQQFLKEEAKYVKYQSGDKRKTSYYAYQKDSGTAERKLKNWILYADGDGKESEAYGFQNAKLKLDDDGNVLVFYDDGKQAQNQQAMADVDQSLLERARKVVQEDAGTDIMAENKQPDFIIPYPYYIDSKGQINDLEWKIDIDRNEILLDFSLSAEQYPIALDPTLQFTAPGQNNSGNVIGGEVSSLLGNAMVSGDFNSDGKTDLAVGAPGYSTNTGRAYIFYNDGLISNTAATADVIITGQAPSGFGNAMISGDFNADGKIDLAVGANSYSGNGGVFIFYNDGSIVTTAVTADVIITGVANNDLFGKALTSGDFNGDGKTDLAVGAPNFFSSNTGYAYIFYGGSMAAAIAAASANVIITGNSIDNLGSAIESGDFNGDGKTDLVVGAPTNSNNPGHAYIFYGGSMAATIVATSANVIITGESGSRLATSLASGDFNADGKTDLAVGASSYSSNTGRAYIFYNDGSIPTTAITADVIITGEASSNFGGSMTTGDFNADGKTDLAVGAYGYSSNTGRAYIFYNDGSIPTTAITADVIITGEATNNFFSYSMTSGDFNSDGKIDLSVGANLYSSNAGRAYIFYSQNGQVNTNKNITGEASSKFGNSMVAGDFNADGRIDLAVGADAYSSNTGRVYIFYNDGSIPTTAATADVIITGAGSYFGNFLTTGDFNADGKTDLAVGAYAYSTNAGRAYIFYNDGSIPTTAATADVIITGEVSGAFGTSMTSGDFNADGKTDLVVGSNGYSASAGRAYIFYNDGSIPTTAASADVIITGEAGGSFGRSMTTGDFNADGKTDLAVGAYTYSSNIGRAYIFYNDGSIPTTAATADVIITGEANSNFGGSIMTAGDFNADGKTDLAVGAYTYSSNTGRAYIFYNDGSIPTTAATADVIITGEGGYFGTSLTAGDFNADGKTDLAIGAFSHSANAGRAYIFYNDGSIPTTAATADVIITGEGGYFGASLIAGDFNADGKIDLAVGAPTYGAGTGRAYIYETRDNYAWQVQQNPYAPRISGTMGQEATTTGEASSSFGTSMATGDFNADGKMDLAVGATAYYGFTGRAYIFYNDGSLTPTAASADVVITGEAGSNRFGSSMTAGDFNADGRTDLAVGAIRYNSYRGRAYIFYSDGFFPATADTADVAITGQVADDEFGTSMTSGDFNADGKTDLAVSAEWYNVNYGRVYIFYNDGSIPTTAATSDVKITGEASGRLGASMTAGDFNADGRTDLAAAADGYSSGAGRVYIFYNDGSIPTTADTADVIITGEAGSYFGSSMVSGDFNADGRKDLAVGAYGYPSYSYAGRAYIFYNDGSIPTTAAVADVIITGEASSYFGASMTSGDFNADGKTDLAVGAKGYSTFTGRAYIFYNDGSIPTTADTADVIITGEAGGYFGQSMTVSDFNADGRIDLIVGSPWYKGDVGRIYHYISNENILTGGAADDNFGYSMISGDFDADGKIDLAVGAIGYNSNTGRAYIFYNRGNILSPDVASADVVITGEADSQFGQSLTTGDFNADGKADLAVGVPGYNFAMGRAYIFYNDGSIPTTAATADVIITGEANSYFGFSMTPGDFNADGRTDLAVGASAYSTYTGRAYIFYNDGSIPTTAATADVIVTGEAGSRFGCSMAPGDFNFDGKIDLVVGAYSYSTSAGRAYIFYNDGSIPTTAATADVKIDGEVSSNFGHSMSSGDFNADGRIDLVVGAYSYNTSVGRAYIFYNDGSIPTTAATADVIITGEVSSNFGHFMSSGDFNADGKTDLAVAANGYSSWTGRAYIFYNDGSIPTTAATADSAITGEAGSRFGFSMTFGDFNADGRADLAVGAAAYGSWAGKVYTYISEVNANANNAPITIKGMLNMKGGVRLQ